MYKLDLEKAEDQRPNCQYLLDHRKKQENSRKTSTSASDYAKAFDCVDHNKLWKILQEIAIPGHLTCLLRNLYAGQKNKLDPDMERTGSKWGKKLRQGCILSPCFFNL